jgi:hypothetical protein
MWYSATWVDDTSFRVQGALDYDDEFSVRHPESMNTAVCVDDLRLGPANPYMFTIPEWAESVSMTASPGLALPLGPIEIEIWNQSVKESERELMVDGMYTLDASSYGEIVIHSSHQLHLLISRGDGGTALMQANDPSPVDSTGTSWSLPLPSGTSKIHVVSEVANQIIVTNQTSTSYYALPSNQNRVGVTFNHQFSLDSAEVIHITTSAPSRLVVQTNIESDVGQIAWPSVDGQFLGHSFVTPSLEGEFVFTNPGLNSVTVTWRGGGLSVAPNQSVIFDWPPAEIDGAPMLDANGDLFVSWRRDTNGSGLQVIPADDTGALSGQFHTLHVDGTNVNKIHLARAGIDAKWNLTGSTTSNGTLYDEVTQATLNLNQGLNQMEIEDGHALRLYHLRGQDGLIQVRHDGAQRCLSINVQASGWISSQLPWQSMSGRSQVDLKNAWRAGTHPASMQITLIGVDGASTHANLGTVWGFHLSRLSYEFRSSIVGMEVAYVGGAVVTNHPEFEPYIIVPPSDRGGPGPRFAATIPSLHPTQYSVSGSGSMNLDIELADRSSLASATAFEVRRGWSNPYGVAIADASADGLESSEDWTIYPGRIDLLTDYVGWVPDPSYGTSEAVWHTNGQPIQFTLQMSSLDVHMTEAIS